MAIQTVDLTVPNGDTPRSANTKINANFTNTTHAASKIVGTASGQIPLAQEVRSAMLSRVDGDKTTTPNDFANGTAWYVASSAPNTPQGFSASRYIIETRSNGIDKTYQRAYGWDAPDAAHRILTAGVWSDWQPLGWNKKHYNTTTAAGANAVLDSEGRILRSTSSERYKDILGDLTLDDATYANAMTLAPIVYRSTADADNPLHHYYSFSAEELGTFDKAFTFWRETETVTDAEGVTTEVALAEPQAEGLNINAILAFNHAISVKQNSLIADLQEQINALKPA